MVPFPRRAPSRDEAEGKERGGAKRKEGAEAINKPRFLIGRREKWSHHVTLHLKIPRWRIPSRAESVGGARAARVRRRAFAARLHAPRAVTQVSTRRLSPGRAVLGPRCPPSSASSLREFLYAGF